MNLMMTAQNKYSDNLYCFLVQKTLYNKEENNYKEYVPHEVCKFYLFLMIH